MLAGITRIASGVEGVGISVAVGMGVCVGTAVGSATSGELLPHETNKANIKVVRRKCLTRMKMLHV
jgi:hypothetical protein